ncbi:hypothetical protein H696_01606 [Fonticula alba]|uniref:EGF-like domain-containing protein n=1 Tax=Fonticula alba TaxID=691883 RepID=A0A058ZFF2_FONAL|nr:hypothetical protein H696_01606 [Fonticula alba]KCV72207.1 hypothetical protein H696_01606 [Fonticula alba]|eukprot:XP_009493785.1 hypothetical protein H696_01606 [Fonticula alba]
MICLLLLALAALLAEGPARAQAAVAAERPGLLVDHRALDLDSIPLFPHKYHLIHQNYPLSGYQDGWYTLRAHDYMSLDPKADPLAADGYEEVDLGDLTLTRRLPGASDRSSAGTDAVPPPYELSGGLFGRGPPEPILVNARGEGFGLWVERNNTTHEYFPHVQVHDWQMVMHSGDRARSVVLPYRLLGVFTLDACPWTTQTGQCPLGLMVDHPFGPMLSVTFIRQQDGWELLFPGSKFLHHPGDFLVSANLTGTGRMDIYQVVVEGKRARLLRFFLHWTGNTPGSDGWTELLSWPVDGPVVSFRSMYLDPKAECPVFVVSTQRTNDMRTYDFLVNRACGSRAPSMSWHTSLTNLFELHFQQVVAGPAEPRRAVTSTGTGIIVWDGVPSLERILCTGPECRNARMDINLSGTIWLPADKFAFVDFLGQKSGRYPLDGLPLDLVLLSKSQFLQVHSLEPRLAHPMVGLRNHLELSRSSTYMLCPPAYRWQDPNHGACAACKEGSYNPAYNPAAPAIQRPKECRACPKGCRTCLTPEECLACASGTKVLPWAPKLARPNPQCLAACPQGHIEYYIGICLHESLVAKPPASIQPRVYMNEENLDARPTRIGANYTAGPVAGRSWLLVNKQTTRPKVCAFEVRPAGLVVECETVFLDPYDNAANGGVEFFEHPTEPDGTQSWSVVHFSYRMRPSYRHTWTRRPAPASSGTGSKTPGSASPVGGKSAAGVKVSPGAGGSGSSNAEVTSFERVEFPMVDGANHEAFRMLTRPWLLRDGSRRMTTMAFGRGSNYFDGRRSGAALGIKAKVLEARVMGPADGHPHLLIGGMSPRSTSLYICHLAGEPVASGQGFACGGGNHVIGIAGEPGAVFTWTVVDWNGDGWDDVLVSIVNSGRTFEFKLFLNARLGSGSVSFQEVMHTNTRVKAEALPRVTDMAMARLIPGDGPGIFLMLDNVGYFFRAFFADPRHPSWAIVHHPMELKMDSMRAALSIEAHDLTGDGLDEVIIRYTHTAHLPAQVAVLNTQDFANHCGCGKEFGSCQVDASCTCAPGMYRTFDPDRPCDRCAAACGPAGCTGPKASQCLDCAEGLRHSPGVGCYRCPAGCQECDPHVLLGGKASPGQSARAGHDAGDAGNDDDDDQGPPLASCVKKNRSK